MKIITHLKVITTVNTFEIDDDGETLHYQEYIDNSGVRIDSNLRDAQGTDIDDAELLERVQILTERY